MVTLEQATDAFKEMIRQSSEMYTLADVWEIPADFGPFYAVLVIDKDGFCSLPGQFFPSIRKADGSLFQYNLPIPT